MKVSLSRLANHFDLNKTKNGAHAKASQRLELTWQIGTYVLVLASIVASRFLDLYRAGASSSFKLDVPYLLFVVIVSLIVFPKVYTKISRDSIFVQICLIFTAGMGWEKIISTAVGK